MKILNISFTDYLLQLVYYTGNVDRCDSLIRFLNLWQKLKKHIKITYSRSQNELIRSINQTVNSFEAINQYCQMYADTALLTT